MAALIIEGQQHQFGAVWGRRSRYTVQKHVQKHIKAACTEAYQSSIYRGISKQHVYSSKACTEAYQRSHELESQHGAL